ncbi:protein-(glutamine-N5) methyltransferase [Bifidobacterium sp. ESL0732]|uniref:protein-(glutamine-N5) methyltransferase n=1 Tax=Bifidobacterium sp. ESL0732 TaxID=2983222 RepID=UPI0023F9F430|nr:protein-(glutamine-N5) methyltransferase [Bifidobacterium sp. ESL0732]WEV64626.1 protein-(glutamine-N5) methyltransferase [Bifidobacterium sp. ESL0732]
MSEIITMKLGPRKPVRHEELPEGGYREFIGWQEGMSPEEVWHAGNSWWKLEPGRAVRCDLAVILNPDNVVVCVAKIRGLIKREDMRMGFIGEPVERQYDAWLGKTLKRNDSKNPIAYFDERDILAPDEVETGTTFLNR